jgi:cobalt-zinc-cadmium efflux system outer membrane protein
METAPPLILRQVFLDSICLHKRDLQYLRNRRIFRRLRVPQSFGLLVAVSVLTGCAGKTIHVERPHLSEDVQRRTGHHLRPNGVAINQLPPGIAIADGISANEAVAIALWNNAAFQENLSKLGLARGDLAQAGLLSNPAFSVLFPVGPKQLEFVATLPLEALWLRPRRVAIARLDAERVAEGLVQSGLDLVRDVRLSLSDLELVGKRARLSRESVSLRERILKITEARQRAGEGNELDTVAAGAEVLRAEDEARRLQRDVIVAEERLLHLVGLTGVITNAGFSPGALPSRLALPLGDLERRAFAARPDLRASELAVKAAGKRAGLARAEIFALSGVIDANGSGKQGFEIGPGAQLPIPIFNQNQAGRARATAEIERAAWNYIGTRQRVTFEVREAHSKYLQAAEAQENWSAQLVPSLEDLVRRSEKACELGELSPLAVQEYVRQLLAGRLRQAELSAELRRAWAEMERSVGMQLSSTSR